MNYLVRIVLCNIHFTLLTKLTKSNYSNCLSIFKFDLNAIKNNYYFGSLFI